MYGDEPNEGQAVAAEARSGFEVRSILSFLRRRRLIILLVALPLLVPATIHPFLLPRYYEATATVEFEKGAPVLDVGRDVLPDGTGQQRLPSMAEASIITLATSDAVLGAVLDKMPASSPAKRSLKDSAKVMVGLLSDEAPTPEQARRLRLEIMRRGIAVSLGGGGDYVLVTATGSTAGNAAFLANAVADSYVKQLAKQREAASQRAVTWLNTQIYELRDQTARKEQDASTLVAQGLNPRIMNDSGDSSDSPLALLEANIQTTRVDLMAARQRLAELTPRGGAQAQDPMQLAERERLHQQLEKESANLEAARLKYTPTHPEVSRLEATVAGLSERAGEGGRQATQSSGELAEYQTLLREKSRLESKLSVLEKSRNEQIAAAQRSDAYSKYRRLESELAIDREMLGVLLSRRNETMLASAKTDTGARILDAAIAPMYPAGPGRRRILMLGWIGALGAGLCFAYLLELIDRRIRDPEGISALLGFPVLCSLPILAATEAVPERQGGLGPGSLGAEGYRSLRTALAFAMRAQKVHTLLVTSGIAGEGKTTTAANLAAAFSRMGRRVVLVDADMRRPRQHRVFDLQRAPGLSEVLSGTARLADALVRPKAESFDLMPAGTMPENPTDLLASPEWRQLMVELKQDYELVILDSPVLLAVADSLLLAADADGVLLVHRPGSLERRGLMRMRSDLRSAGARVLGVAFNLIDPGDRDQYPSYLESPYLRESERKRSFWAPR